MKRFDPTLNEEDTIKGGIKDVERQHHCKL